MIVHGLVVHSAQPGDGGVQLTEVVMSAGSLGWVHCRVTMSQEPDSATTSVGAPSSTEGIGYLSSNTLIAVTNQLQQWKFRNNASYYRKMTTIIKYILQIIYRVGNVLL